METWTQQIAGQGITAVLLGAALVWLGKRLAAIEEKLEAERAKCQAELKAERDKREALEASHSQAVLGLGLKSAKALDRVADVLERKL